MEQRSHGGTTVPALHEFTGGGLGTRREISEVPELCAAGNGDRKERAVLPEQGGRGVKTGGG